MQGIEYIVDIIPEKVLADAIEEVLHDDGTDSGEGSDSGDDEPPILLDDEELVKRLRNEVREVRLE